MQFWQYKTSVLICYFPFPILQSFYVQFTVVVVSFCIKLVVLAMACIRYFFAYYLEYYIINISYWLLMFSTGWSSTPWMVRYLGISCFACLAGCFTVHLCPNYAVITGQSIPTWCKHDNIRT